RPRHLEIPGPVLGGVPGPVQLPVLGEGQSVVPGPYPVGNVLRRVLSRHAGSPREVGYDGATRRCRGREIRWPGALLARSEVRDDGGPSAAVDRMGDAANRG